MVSVALKNIKKTYGENLVLAGLDLYVRDKEFMVVLGSSGCGKTTLLHIIAGLVKQDVGDVYFGGKIVNITPPEERAVGLVFQDYALFPHLTVYDNVAFGLKSKKYDDSQIEKKVEEKLRFLNIEELRNRYPSTLSGGQQQRVALARALTVEPRVLLLDEPLSDLDAKMREHLRTELRQVHNKLGITTIYVTHDQIDAITMSDRVAVLHDRKIEQVGRPGEIFFKPKTEYVASFVGAENIFRGRISKINREAGTAKVAVGDIEISATFNEELSVGDHVSLLLRPDDVIVMLDKHTTSARNLFKGVIEKKLLLGSLIRFNVSVGKHSFIVVVTRNAASELKLDVGKKVYIAFKATAVNLIKSTA